MLMTLEVPDELALRLQSLEHEIPQILALGLQGFNPENSPLSPHGLEIYPKLMALEKQLEELRQMIWQLTPRPVIIESQHPVQLEGLWAGVNITEEDILAARNSMFSYEHGDK